MCWWRRRRVIHIKTTVKISGDMRWFENFKIISHVPETDQNQINWSWARPGLSSSFLQRDTLERQEIRPSIQESTSPSPLSWMMLHIPKGPQWTNSRLSIKQFNQTIIYCQHNQSLIFFFLKAWKWKSDYCGYFQYNSKDKRILTFCSLHGTYRWGL